MTLNPKWFEVSECGLKCHSRKCVTKLNAVITKGNLGQVKVYVRNNCPTSTVRHDLLGRFPIHIAASCGKIEVLDWLISTFQCDLNVQDKESGWTALHRALYYGRLACAILLVEYGASMWLRDKEGLTPMDITTLDSTPWVKYLHFSRRTYEMPCILSSADPSEVYTWGINDNFVLGHGNLRSRKLPESVEFFSKRGILIKQVVVAKFHSVFVSKSGFVFACGHGEGGRLGNGHQDACLEPAIMTLNAGVEISTAAAGLNHTALTTETGQLLTCGLNRHHVLGVATSSDRELVPGRVHGALKLLKVVGCAAAALHTVAWTDNGALYTFGTNAGQLGHARSDLYVKQPRQVSGVYNENDMIICVHACDSATIVATKQGTVYLLQNYVCRKIFSKQLDIEKVQVGGGRLDVTVLAQVDQRMHAVHTQLKDEGLHVLIRKKSGDVLSWSKLHGTLDRCRFNLPQSFLFKDVILCNHGHTALFITNMGQVFVARYGNWRASKSPRRSSGISSNTSAKLYDSCLDMLDSDAVQEFTMDQVSSAFRAHTGALGPKGKVGAILQCEPRNFLTEVPLVGESEMQKDMTSLWESNGVSDLTLTATDRKGNKLSSLQCHNYILCSGSTLLKKFLSKSDCDDISGQLDGESSNLVFENCDPTILKNAVELIYCKSCQLLRDGYEPPSLAQGTNSSDVTIRWASDVKIQNGVTGTGEETIHIGNMSAYAAHQKPEKTKKGKLSNARVSSPKNILSEFKIFIKKLGIQDPLIEAVTLHHGVINSKKDGSTNIVQFPPFDRHKFRNLYDIKLECSDGVVLDAHKCVLVARVEFFRSMLLSQWAERSAAVSKVPIPSEVFKHVLEYVYTDSSLVLSSVSSLEILCEVMAAADQLLIARLKEMVEVQVASMLTLKNVSSVIEFASAFHCTQLRKACEQFICHHFPALMHTPHFYSIEYTTLENTEDQYRSNINAVYMRTMTPDSEAPELPEVYDFDSSQSSLKPSSPSEKYLPRISDTSSSWTKRQGFPGRRKGMGNKKKSIPRSSSYHGITLSELLSKHDENIDVLLDQITSSSLQTAQIEKQPITESGEELPSPVSIVRTTSPPNSIPEVKPQVAVVTNLAKPKIGASVRSFKDIMAAQETRSHTVRTIDSRPSGVLAKDAESPWGKLTAKSPQSDSTAKSPQSDSTAKSPQSDVNHGVSGTVISLKSKKLSQKRRKKLIQEAALTEHAQTEQKVQDLIVTSSPPTNAWGVATSPSNSKSFWDVVKEQSSLPEPKSTNPLPRATSPVKQIKSANDSPWQSVSKVERKPRRTSASFKDIMQNEIHETERAFKQKNKPLHLIQLEDQAMVELKAHYEKTVPPIDGQYFTVERLQHKNEDF